MEQQPFAFDPVSVQKIIKGAYIAFTGTFVVGILAVAWSLDVERASILALLSFLVPVCVNAVREYVKGKDGFDFTKFPGLSP